MSYIIHGRCRSGSRWFWIAALMEYGDDAHKCDNPVCIYGGPHEYGWEDAEDLALKAMAEAVARLGGEVLPGTYRGNAPGSAGQASSALKRINAAKRAARPPSGSTDAGAVEYLYGAYISSWVDDMTGESVERVIPFQITRRTARRVYYIRRPGCPEWNDPPVIGFITGRNSRLTAGAPEGGAPIAAVTVTTATTATARARSAQATSTTTITTCSPCARRPMSTSSAGSASGNASGKNASPSSSSSAARWPPPTLTAAAPTRSSSPHASGTSRR